MIHLKDQIILIVSNEPWGGLWYSKHNYANALSKENIVFFLDPPKKWRLKNIFCSKIRKSEVKNNLFLIEYDNVLPGNQKNKIIFYLNEFFAWRMFRRYFRKNKISKPIFWSFDPYRMLNPKYIHPLLSVFFFADEYQRNSYLKKLIKSVDLILSISEHFFSNENIVGKPCLALKHSLPDSFFSLDERDFNSEQLRDYILFIGSIDYRIDTEVVRNLAVNFPDKLFLFLGPLKRSFLREEEVSFYENFDNVVLAGSVPFEDLKYYIEKSRVCIVPMSTKVPGNLINHQKIIQYFAFGKPVVSPLFSDFENLQDLFYIYKTPEEAVEMLKNALEEKTDDPNVKKRINFAQEHMFSKQIEKIEKFINENAYFIHNSK